MRGSWTFVDAKRDWSGRVGCGDSKLSRAKSAKCRWLTRSGWVQAGLSEPGSANGSLSALIVEDLTERPINIGVELLLGLQVRQGSRTPEGEKSVKMRPCSDSCAEPFFRAGARAACPGLLLAPRDTG